MPKETTEQRKARVAAGGTALFSSPVQDAAPTLGASTVVRPTNINSKIPTNTGSGATSVVNTGSTPVPPPNTGAQPGSVSYLLGDGAVGAEQKWLDDYIAKQNTIYNTPIDEGAIRAQKEAEMQAQIDAINKVYADKLVQSKMAGQGRVGTNVAQQARGGLLGSDFGTAQQNQIQDVNAQANNLVEQERLSLVNALLSDARTNASSEIADKRAAVEAGGKALLEYYAGASDRKASKTKSAAQKILALGKNPQDVSDEELKQLGISRQDLTIDFTMLKQAQDSAQATAQSEADKAALEGKKTQAEIDKLTAETALKKVEAGEYYEVGGKIYQKGTNNYIGDARSVANAAGGGSVGGSASGFSSSAPSGGFRTDRHNNPTAMTTDVARTLGLVEGSDYTKGDPFPNNPNLFTARLTGDAVQTTIKALDTAANDPNKNAFRTQGGQPRWTYIDMSDEQWNSMSSAEKVATITKMYQNEGGTGALVGASGGTGQLSDLAQSVQKGIITIAQIPAAQRSKVAAELSRAGESSPKSVELQNSLSLVDTMLQDEDSLKSISGWWGGRLPLTGIFSNQLAANQFDQLKGILSLGEREKLKGSGAISDFESKMLAQSASALGRNLSEKDFKAELEKIRDILSGKYKYLTSDIGSTGSGASQGQQSSGGRQAVDGAI